MGWFDEFLGVPKESLYKYYKILKIRKGSSNYKIKKSAFKLMRDVALASCPAFFDFETWNDKYKSYANARRQLLWFSNSERRKNYKTLAAAYLPEPGLAPQYHVNFPTDPEKFLNYIMEEYGEPPCSHFSGDLI